MKAERGAALVTAMLFMVLTFILISTMLANGRDAVIISRLHRDAVRALELAEAGVQEAVQRIVAGHPYRPGFTSSMKPGVTVTVTRQFVGTNSAYQEIVATATAGQATRRISYLVLQRTNMAPPNITFASSLGQAGNGSVASGDVYARTFIQYQKNPTPGLTYAGWWIAKNPPGPIGPCYTHTQCVSMGALNWYPATPLSEFQSTPTGIDIKAQTRKCPAGGGGLLPIDQITGVLASDSCNPACTAAQVKVYGFDTDDSGTGPLAVTAALPCGLPYKMVSQTVQGPNGSVTLLFKTIVYEQWFANYWQFDERQLTYMKTTPFMNNPQFGAIPPFPPVNLDPSSYDLVQTGGGTISQGTFGCKYPEMSCSPPVSQPMAVLLIGDWHFAGHSAGHGTLVVNGNLTLDGQFTYYGTIYVTGSVSGAGLAVTTFGGLIANATLTTAGNFTINGGSTLASVPVGPSQVVGKTWQER